MYEVQFHPADIRKQVRYFFLPAVVVRWIVAGMILAGLVILAGLALAPFGIRSLLLASQVRVAANQKKLQTEILAGKLERLEELQKQLERAETLGRQIALILGAPEDTEPEDHDREESTGMAAHGEARVALRLAHRLDARSAALIRLADRLERFAKEHQDLTRIVPSICPLPIGSFVLTSPFGERTSPFTNRRDFHAGIDLAAREGTPVYATGDGRVVFAGRYPLRRNVRWWRYGTLVVLDHGGRYLTIYAHLSKASVHRGQKVHRGEVIGEVGNTGWSTSPHLHYEVRVRHGNGEPVPADPRIFILNYQWHGHEKLLSRSRWAPPPEFDPLPRLFTR